MRMRNLFGIVMFGVLALACAEDVAPEFDNEDPAADEAAADDDSKADVAGGTYTYYTVRRDFRRCAAPMCGGYWVDRVNATKTRCADGTYQPECYVADLDLVTKMGFRETERERVQGAIGASSAVLRGVVKKKVFIPGSQPLGLFEAREAWVAATDAAPEGTFSKIVDSGIRCIAAPCPSLHEAKLNSSAHKNIAGVDLEALNLDEGEQHLANVFLQGEGLIVAGYRGTTSGPAGDAPTREATQAYFRVVAPAIEPIPCFVGGCSGQVCSSDPGVITTCEWRPEYECYRSATCGIDADGACGWVETEALTSCLEGSR